jgi:peptide/nickel transport system permease protein
MTMLLRRLGFYVVTAFIAATLDFLIPHLIPGNPVESVIASQAGAIPPQATASLYAQFGIKQNESLWDEYLHYWNTLLHGNLGLSISHYPTPVTSVIQSAIFWTVLLVGVSTVISFVLGTVIGALAAWRRGTWVDGVLPISTFFQAMPYFFLATLLLLLFATELKWLPDHGGYDFQNTTIGLNGPFLSDALKHAILPAITIIGASLAGWIIGMRNMMITVRDEDYVLLAEAERLPRRRVIWYAARNAVLPSVSSFALALSFVVSGSLLTEIVFSYPGIGDILYQAVVGEDFPLVQGIFLIITFVVLAANLLADVVYVFLDPRARQEA